MTKGQRQRQRESDTDRETDTGRQRQRQRERDREYLACHAVKPSIAVMQGISSLEPMKLEGGGNEVISRLKKCLF